MTHGRPAVSDDAPSAPDAAEWMGADPQTSGIGEQRRLAMDSLIALLLLNAGSTLVIATRQPGSAPDRTWGLVLLAILGLLTATVVHRYRHARLGRPALLLMIMPPLGLYAYTSYFTHDPYLAGGYIFIVAVWVGLGQARWVNVALAPLYAVAYWLPLSLHRHSASLDHSVLGVVGVAVVGGETVSWLTTRLASLSVRLRGQDLLRFAVLDGESSDVRVVVDPLGTVVYVSATVESVFGYRADQIRGQQVNDAMAMILLPDDLIGAVATLDAATRSTVAPETFVARLLHVDQTLRYVEVKVRNLLDDDAVGSVILDFWDVTDRVEGRIRLEASEESFRLLFQLSPLPTIVCDPLDLRCLRVNDAACAHYGYTHEEFLAMTIVDLLPGDAATDVPVRPPPGGFLRPGSWQHRTKGGRLIDVEISVTRTPLAVGGATMMLIVDVTEQRALEDQLRHLALHDGVTGLANRALFEDRLDRALAASTRGAKSVAVLFCDLDGFQSVNDSLGSDAGDEVLRTVASRLDGIVRPGDTVARFGSHEFAVVVALPNEAADALMLADRIIGELAQAITLDGQQITLAVSVGIAFGGSTARAGEISRNAVAANREAKASGKNGYRIFEASMRAEALRRLQLTGDLRTGLDHEQFRLQYQPHVALATGQVEGFEALVRWDHPLHGTIPPLDFVPLAEESGLIVPLGRWILEEACLQAASWPGPLGATMTVAVNLSVRQLRSKSIAHDVRAALALSGLDASRLVLEITESVIMEDTSASISIFDELRALGVRLSIDDFGTGYSSLSYLRRFSFDVLKIDKAFVDGMADRPEQSSAFIRTIVTLGHTLGMHIITEGIETAEQYRELRRLGSDAGQGYLVSRPMDPDGVAAFIDRPASDYGLGSPLTT